MPPPRPKPNLRPKYFSSSFEARGVPPGGHASTGGAGFFVAASGNVSVSIENDPSSVFQLTQLMVWGLQDVPVEDLLPGHAPLQDIVVLQRVNGQGPIFVGDGQAISAEITFSPPQDAQQDAFTATAVFQASGWPSAVKMPITGGIGSIRVYVLTPVIDIIQGDSAIAQVQVTSLAGPAVDVVFQGFRDSDGISMDLVTVHVSKGSSSTVSLNFTANNDAPLGLHGQMGPTYTSFDNAQHSDINQKLALNTLPAPLQVHALTNSVTIIRSGQVSIPIQVSALGVTTTIAIGLEVAPSGIVAAAISETVDPLVWGSVFTRNLVLYASAQAPMFPAQTPVQLNWSAYGGQQSGKLNVALTMLEDSVVYSSGFLGPSTVTGIGQVGFTKDGGVGFRGHVRESGAIGHDYTLVMAFPDIKDSLGKVLVFTMQGEVHGLDAGSRSSDWERGGAKYDRIRTLIIDNWARLSTGTRCESTLHVSTSVVSVLNIVRDFLLVIIPGVETGANLVEFIESGNCTWGVGITGGPEDHPGVGGGARFRCEK